MFAVTHEDIVAVRRAYMVGMDNALAECRRRWPALPDRALGDAQKLEPHSDMANLTDLAVET